MPSDQFVIVTYAEPRKVFAGGVKLGMTNALLPINQGTHTFTLADPQDYEPASQKRKVVNTTVVTPMLIRFTKIAVILLFAMLLPGCAHHPVNVPLQRQDPTAGYRFKTTPHEGNSDDLFVILAFSGGGTRAAALSYGALEELAATTLTINGRKRRLLDEVDIISSVSGGSFTAAYYGLHGDRIFEEFEPRFLNRNVQGALALRMLSPINWLRLASPTFDRIDMAAEYYDRQVFDGHTFRDLERRRTRPFIVLNATDMSLVSRFEFTQDQFDVLGSDLSSYPVSRAVAASSAFPILLSPLTVHNHPQPAGYQPPAWLDDALENREIAPREFAYATAVKSYIEPASGHGKSRPFIHLLDGGLSDNIGLRGPAYAITSVQNLWSLKGLLNTSIKHLLVITVNAKTDAPGKWDRREKAPGIPGMLSVVTTGPLGNYSDETVQYLTDTFETYRQQQVVAERFSELQGFALPKLNGAKFYHIEVNFRNVQDKAERDYLLNVGTSFSLPKKAIDHLRETAHTQIRESGAMAELRKEFAN